MDAVFSYKEQVIPSMANIVTCYCYDWPHRWGVYVREENGDNIISCDLL
jgi:hypothetical protein